MLAYTAEYRRKKNGASGDWGEKLGAASTLLPVWFYRLKRKTFGNILLLSFRAPFVQGSEGNFSEDEKARRLVLGKWERT